MADRGRNPHPLVVFIAAVLVVVCVVAAWVRFGPDLVTSHPKKPVAEATALSDAQVNEAIHSTAPKK